MMAIEDDGNWRSVTQREEGNEMMRRVSNFPTALSPTFRNVGPPSQSAGARVVGWSVDGAWMRLRNSTTVRPAVTKSSYCIIRKGGISLV
jgi:hypothetical protein